METQHIKRIFAEMETNKEVNTEKEKTTLLLVEDNPDLLSITRNSLQQWYHVRCAENGRKSLGIIDGREHRHYYQ